MPIIDIHCHIYPEKIAERAVDSIARFYNTKMNENGCANSLISEGKKAGISHFVVHSVATKPEQVQSINNFIACEVQKSNGLMTGFGTLHPDSTNIEADLNFLLELGLKGVKLHPDFQCFALDSEKSINLCQIIADKLPVLIHCGDTRYNFSNPNQLKKLMNAVPNLLVIGAHFGGWSCWEEATQILAHTPNLFVDCSSSLFAIKPQIATKLIHQYGADKVLFGSDFPMWNPDKELERFYELGLTADEENLILYKNTADLLNIKINEN